MKIQSNKLTDKKSGLVQEFLGDDVATGAGQTKWLPSVGYGYLEHTVEPWVNDAGSPISYAGYADITGDMNYECCLPKLHSGQGFIMWLCSEFSGAQNSLAFGNSTTTGQIKLKKAVAILTDSNGETLTTPALAAAATPQFITCVYDPSAETFKMHQYDLVGNLVETTVGIDSGSFDFTLPISFSEDATLASIVTESVGFDICSMGIIYFDTMPSDIAIATGLSSMSADPESGCYNSWR